MNLNMKNLFSRPRRTPKAIFIAVGIAVFFVTSGILFYEGTKKTVALTLDGEKQKVKTHASTIDELLRDLNVPLGKEDYLSLSANTKIKNDLHVTWEPASKIKMLIDGEEKKIWTTTDTVGEMLEKEGIIVEGRDYLSVEKSKPIKDGMTIKLKNAFPIQLAIGKDKKDIWTTSDTVADLLKRENIQVDKMDKIKPALDNQLTPDLAVTITRVEKVTDVVEEPIKFATITKKDDSLSKGKEKIVTEGETGLLTKKYEVIKENGEVVSKKLISTTTSKEKTDRVIAVGTKSLVAQVSRGGNVSGTEYYMTATAYTASCNGCTGKTATGFDLRSNPNAKIIAVDPSVIPLGSRVYVEGYGYAIAADTGGSINGNKIDVFVPTQSQAYHWGVKRVKVRVLQ